MPIELLASHNVRTGFYRLTMSPKDVRAPQGRDGHALGLRAAPADHRTLFARYIEGLSRAYELAAANWNGQVEDLVAEGMSLPQAIAAKIDLGVAGPAAHPRVVWVVRKYWLACCALNRSGAAILPETFMLEWLAEAGKHDFVRLLTAMPYWPIGLDPDGNWC